MNKTLLDRAVADISFDHRRAIAILRASASDIDRFASIVNAIEARGYLITPKITPILTISGGYSDMQMIVTTSPGRAADLIELLQAKGIMAERVEATGAVFSGEKWHLTAFNTLPITLYINHTIYPRKPAEN